ncbi:hypothetical protein QYE76_033351 [Lolium multiflorum]|uniref:DUF4218 domain-containing protein n=1 Tax=Lolium multiflorum TaxID=4521 RepID=A0AAD8VMA3_LOLMU|nr:hypothetical protein QYE76_033351 [Lolium multiflorum]
MKSHDCHVLMTQILPVAIRGIMDAHVRETLFGLCNFFDVISRKSVGVRQLRRLQEEIVVILYELEMYFPPAFFDVMVHLLVHIVEDIIQRGPTFLHSMMPFERMNGVIKGSRRRKWAAESSSHGLRACGGGGCKGEEGGTLLKFVHGRVSSEICAAAGKFAGKKDSFVRRPAPRPVNRSYNQPGRLQHPADLPANRRLRRLGRLDRLPGRAGSAQTGAGADANRGDYCASGRVGRYHGRSTGP